MMNYYMVAILNELVKDDRISNLYGIAKDNNRKIYISGNEYQEYSMDLVFIVDTGDLFKKTIAYTLLTNSFSLEIEVIRHYSSESLIFSRRPVGNITEYIINGILKFKNQDNKNNNYLKVSNS